jgi:hypothetical protein
MDTHVLPSNQLADKVMGLIAAERRRRACCRRFTFASAVCMAMLIAFWPLANALLFELRSSGFSRFMGLIFSDTRLVLTNWQDYLLSLLESFPILHAAGLLSAIVIILVCARTIARYYSSLVPTRRLKIIVH